MTAVTAVSGGVASADPQTAETQYPESFTRTLAFSSLSDYAVGTGAYAFAEGKTVKVLTEDALSVYSLNANLTALDYADGSFYYRDEYGRIGSLPVEGRTEHSFDFPAEISIGDYYYYIQDSEWKVLNKTDDSVAPLTGYSGVKKYGDTVYAIFDNALCILDGAESTKLDFTYIDYSAAREISVGQTAETLKATDSRSIGIATLKSVTDGGFPVYLTEIDLNRLDGETFAVGDTYRIGEQGAPAPGDLALFLGTTGNAYVISVGATAYLLAKTGADVSTVPPGSSSFNRATVSVDNSCYAYASPYIGDGTQTFALTAGKEVTVTGRADKRTFPYLAYDFYLIQTTDGDGNEVTGYVPEGYLSEYTFIEKPPEETKDPDYTEESYLRTVVLILIVIALVLIAAGYLVYVGTAEKKQVSSRKDEPKDQN